MRDNATSRARVAQALRCPAECCPSPAVGQQNWDRLQEIAGHAPWLVLDITRTAFKRQVDSGERRVYLPWHADMRASYNHNIMTAWVADGAAGADIPGLCFYRFKKATNIMPF